MDQRRRSRREPRIVARTGQVSGKGGVSRQAIKRRSGVETVARCAKVRPACGGAVPTRAKADDYERYWLAVARRPLQARGALAVEMIVREDCGDEVSL